MRFLYKFLDIFFKSDEDKQRLKKVVIPSFAIQSTTIILGFLTSFLLAKGLGPDKYGVFAFSFSFVLPLVSFASLGIGVLIVREIPYIQTKGTPGLLKGLHFWTLRLVLGLCVLLTLGIIAVAYFFPQLLNQKYTISLMIAAGIVPFYGLMNYYSALLRGSGHILPSQIADNLVRPVFFMLALLFLYFSPNMFTTYTAMIVNILAFAAAMMYSSTMFYKSVPIKGITAEYDTSRWWMGIASLSLFNGILSLDSRIDILMLGFIKDSAQVGIYSIAHKVAMALYFFLSVMNTITAPSVSRLYHSGQKEKLQEMLSKTMRYVMMLTVPACIILIVFSKYIMLYFGKEYEQGQTALIILCVTQLISVAFGSVGIVTMMTGHEKYNSIATFISIVINIAGNLILTPLMGVNGTAISAAISILVWNIYLTIIVRKKVGVSPWVLAIK
jgi:O-antigen/teichoic acid export membrane protein